MGKLIREIPSYYNDFECKGNTTCIDTCCIVWDLPVDNKTRDYYLNYEGEFGDYLRSNIYSDDNGKWFIKLKEGGVCPFLTDDKLCNVRLNAGESAQIKICDIYPREREIMAGNYRLNRLLLACSEVARLLYTQTGDRLEFIRTEEDTDDEVSDGLRERTALLLAFRDGLVEGLQSGAFDDSLFRTYESAESFRSLFDDAVYCEGREPGETVLKTAREITKEAGEWREVLSGRSGCTYLAAEDGCVFCPQTASGYHSGWKHRGTAYFGIPFRSYPGAYLPCSV